MIIIAASSCWPVWIATCDVLRSNGSHTFFFLAAVQFRGPLALDLELCKLVPRYDVGLDWTSEAG